MVCHKMTAACQNFGLSSARVHGRNRLRRNRMAGLLQHSGPANWAAPLVLACEIDKLQYNQISVVENNAFSGQT